MKEGDTLLQHVCKGSGDVSVVRELVGRGADADKLDESGNTCLLRAILAGNFEAATVRAVLWPR